MAKEHYQLNGYPSCNIIYIFVMCFKMAWSIERDLIFIYLFILKTHTHISYKFLNNSSSLES